MKKKFILTFLTTIFLNACSIDTEQCTKVDQDSIYQSLSASYDQGSDRTSASVTLRFGGSTGTTLQANGNCAITHDAYQLEEENLLGTRYAGGASGFRGTHTFSFRDNDNRSYQNTGTIVSVAFSGAPPTTISKASGVTIPFNVTTGSSDYVQAYLVSSGTSIVNSTGGSGATSVQITPSDLSLVATGTGTLYLRRVKANGISQGTSEGGDFLSTYTTNKVSVNITN